MSPYIRELRERLGTRRLLMPSAAGIVRDSRGRVLLVRQHDSGVWSTPGGIIEMEDTPADEISEAPFSSRDAARSLPMSPWLPPVLDRLFDESLAGWFEPSTWHPPE